MWEGAGDHGSVGDGPRAMPLRAAPGEKLGAAACAADPAQRATGATDTRCPPYGVPATSANAQPGTNLRSRRPWHHREGPSGSSASDSTTAAGAYGDGMTGGEDEPEPDGS